MQYPFKQMPHIVYANTFLQNVLVEWTYCSEIKDIDIEKTNNFLLEKFNLRLNPVEVHLPINISSKTQPIKLSFGEKIFKLNIKVSAYRGFASLHSFVTFGEEFMNLMQVNEVQRLAIRKINAWPYKNVRGVNTPKEIILKKIFSKELLEGIDLHPSGNASPIFWNKEFRNTSNKEKVDVKFGSLLSEANLLSDLSNDIIILDTLVERNVNLETNFILNTLDQMNQVLFDVFHWSVTPSIIDIMKGDMQDE